MIVQKAKNPQVEVEPKQSSDWYLGYNSKIIHFLRPNQIGQLAIWPQKHYSSSIIGLIKMLSTNTTNWTAKMPTTTEAKLNEADLTLTIKGIAKMAYLNRIEENPMALALARDCPKVIGIDFPSKKKLMMLKRVPSRRPLAMAF
jgi:hypothetical protein